MAEITFIITGFDPDTTVFHVIAKDMTTSVGSPAKMAA